jgi:glutamate formiminotransferase
MNLVNYEATGMTQAYKAVRDEADRLGVGVVSTEIVGLVPEKGLDMNAEYFEKLENFSEDKIFENRLRACR